MMRRGLLAEFPTGDALIAAVRALHQEGYSRFDAFTPYPLPAVQRLLGWRRSRINYIAAFFGLSFALGAYLLQWWTAARDYPVIVGSRPAYAAPAFVPITFEMCVLGTSLSVLAALFVIIGLPRLWHPVFAIPGFERATIDRFFLGVDESDPYLDRDRTTRALLDLGALRVSLLGEEAPPP